MTEKWLVQWFELLSNTESYTESCSGGRLFDTKGEAGDFAKKMRDESDPKRRIVFDPVLVRGGPALASLVERDRP